MSDDEGFGRRAVGDPEVALPKTTVNKFANELAAGMDMRLAGETRELLADCCSEFIQLVSSEANEICEREKKKTIMPEHILSALRELGFGRYYEEVSEMYEEKLRKGERLKSRGGWTKMQKPGVSAEDLLRQQQELFNLAKNDPLAGDPLAGDGREHDDDVNEPSNQ